MSVEHEDDIDDWKRQKCNKESSLHVTSDARLAHKSWSKQLTISTDGQSFILLFAKTKVCSFSPTPSNQHDIATNALVERVWREDGLRRDDEYGKFTINEVKIDLLLQNPHTQTN